MNIHYKTIRRVIITGPREELPPACKYAIRNGYHIIRSGPVPDGVGKVDPTRFKVVAEKSVAL